MNCSTVSWLSETSFWSMTLKWTVQQILARKNEGYGIDSVTKIYWKFRPLKVSYSVVHYSMIRVFRIYIASLFTFICSPGSAQINMKSTLTMHCYSLVIDSDNSLVNSRRCSRCFCEFYKMHKNCIGRTPLNFVKFL